eukprot:CAMPEP_0185196116 /NCGR_PEP_ID=MMETSP1140-20130426/36638_1 /TAXON_ID=298111 /ORGANISM="Pavlova sp., Strain CCMP459" /LENGTH=89 /DNA_ID=CAMNT_0027763129 /DNA_START=22 /DNA_END=289 /DNA_ORIENTATION=+
MRLDSPVPQKAGLEDVLILALDKGRPLVCRDLEGHAAELTALAWLCGERRDFQCVRFGNPILIKDRGRVRKDPSVPENAHVAEVSHGWR